MRHAKEQEAPTGKKSVETVSEEVYTVDLVDQDFKSVT